LSEIKEQKLRHLLIFVEIMIAFSMCNKPFKPLGFPWWMTVVSSGFAEEIPIKSLRKKRKREREIEIFLYFLNVHKYLQGKMVHT